MGWETRNGSGSYYVRKVREGKQVRSEYLGSNAFGSMLAKWDDEDRAVGRCCRHSFAPQRARLKIVEGLTAAFCKAVAAACADVLTEAGYQRHKRGPWRKKRMAKQIASKEAAGEPESGDLVARRREAARAGSTDPAACQALYQIMDGDGRSQAFVEQITSPAQQLLLLEENLLVREAYTRQMVALRSELGADTAPALERLLIERIVLCGHALQKAELSHARFRLQDRQTMAEGNYLDLALERAQKRYLAAIQALATVRKLKLPDTVQAVQVNIGDKQINVVQHSRQE